MNLNFTVVAGGFVQNGYQYTLQLQGGTTHGSIIVTSENEIPSYTKGATVVVSVAMTGVPPAPTNA